VSDELTGVSKAAAFHGIAINNAYPSADRLQAAVQALDIYEQEYDTLVAERDRLQRDRDNLTIMFNDEVRWRNAESSRAETLRTQLMQAERVVEALAASLDWVRVDACARCAQGICSTHQPAAGVIAATARPDKEN
jgi:hypothetical protein